jgi:hypothetical protein
MLFDLLIIIHPVLTLNVSYYNMGWQVADATVTEGAWVSVAIMSLYVLHDSPRLQMVHLSL